MSKLFKDLKYDDDRVNILGDQVLVSGGNTGEPSKLSPSGKTWVSTYVDWIVDSSLYNVGSDFTNLRYRDTDSGYDIAINLEFDVDYPTFYAGNAGFVTVTGRGAWLITGSGMRELQPFDIGKMQTTFKLPSPTSDSTYGLIYTINSEIVFKKDIDPIWRHLFYDTNTIKIKIKTSTSPMTAVLELCGREYSGSLEVHNGHTPGKLISRTLAYADQIPTNTHDADKVISTSGVTIVRSLDNGTATITHPGKSGSLGAPVVTFSSDFSFGNISRYAGTTFSMEGPYTVDSWTVWIKVGDTIPSGVGDIMSKEFILASPNASLNMFFSEGSDFANIQNLDTQNPTVSLYNGAAGSATMVRNYADVTETLAVTTDIRRMSRVMYELVIGDNSTPATTVPVTEDYNFYKFWIGSNGVFPTFTFSFLDFSSTPALFPFTVYAHVDSSATTLTGPSGWLWVSGAGLPTSNFAGKGIWMSGVISTNEQNAVPLMSCWRVA